MWNKDMLVIAGECVMKGSVVRCVDQKCKNLFQWREDPGIQEAPEHLVKLRGGRSWKYCPPCRESNGMPLIPETRLWQHSIVVIERDPPEEKQAPKIGDLVAVQGFIGRLEDDGVHGKHSYWPLAPINGQSPRNWARTKLLTSNAPTRMNASSAMTFVGLPNSTQRDRTL